MIDQATITITVDGPIYDQLDAIATVQGVEVEDLVRRIVEREVGGAKIDEGGRNE
jgi:fructose-1,6-bisphosphatase/sedoheptulose 1,7-bisphosphatase-like protein